MGLVGLRRIHEYGTEYVSLYFRILEVVRSLIRVQSQGLCDKSTATHETDCTRFLILNCHSVSYLVELVTLSAAVLKLTLPLGNE